LAVTAAGTDGLAEPDELGFEGVVPEPLPKGGMNVPDPDPEPDGRVPLAATFVVVLPAGRHTA
jgi:hypothetical protein